MWHVDWEKYIYKILHNLNGMKLFGLTCILEKTTLIWKLARAKYFSHKNQKCAISISITYQPNAKSEKLVCTNIKIVYTHTKLKNKHMGIANQKWEKLVKGIPNIVSAYFKGMNWHLDYM